MRPHPSRIPLIALRAAVLLAAGLACPPSGAGEDSKIRGIVLSTRTSNHEWGGDEMGSTMDDLRSLGAGWVATHPYARIEADGGVRFRDFDPADPPAYLVRPIREAHQRGLKVLIMPHLAHWGSPFSWRGEIGFHTAEEWRRFFGEYRRWIVAVAAACREADGFVIGSELDRTVGHEPEWRETIAAIRAVTPAPLTYAANWTDYQRVPFWDAVDVIGIQAYFPLADREAAPESVLVSAWRSRMRELRDFAERRGQWIVFTELGYNRSFAAAERPWDAATDGPEAEPFQALCMRVALEQIEQEPRVIGAFLWKWFPNPHPAGRSFALATPRMREAIARVWRANGVRARER